MEHERRVPEVLDDERQRHHDVTDQEEGEIGRRIIGAVVVELLAAMAAALGHLEIGGEERSRAAMRAAPEKSEPERAPHRSRWRVVVFSQGIGGGRGHLRRVTQVPLSDIPPSAAASG